MTNIDLSTKTIDQLQSELKTSKIQTIGLVFVLIPLFTISLYKLFRGEDTSMSMAILATGIACSASLRKRLDEIKKIQKELELRNQ